MLLKTNVEMFIFHHHIVETLKTWRKKISAWKFV